MSEGTCPDCGTTEIYAHTFEECVVRLKQQRDEAQASAVLYALKVSRLLDSLDAAFARQEDA
jgi:hypothetical protein